MSRQLMDRILRQLRDQVLNLLDDLLVIVPNEPDILIVRLFFENQMDTKMLMDGFYEWVYPWREHIRDHNEDYFEDNDHMFGPLPPNKIQRLKVKMTDGTFTASDKEVIWAYFEVFISLIEQYEKINNKIK